MKSLILFLSLISSITYAEPIAMAENLAVDGKTAQQENKPIVFFMTAGHCPYCEQLREEYFQFSPSDERFILREIELDEGPDLIGFNGDASTHRKVAKKHQVFLTPTVVFVDSKGDEIVEPMVGVPTMEFYHFYFEQALEKAIAKVQPLSTADAAHDPIKE
ncbi:MAG: thioredoxin fold domain-containing protein [Arenicellales bacterium]